MTTKQKRKKLYLTPTCSVLYTSTDPLMQTGSGNAGTISQGQGGGDAKAFNCQTDEYPMDDSPLWDNDLWKD